MQLVDEESGSLRTSIDEEVEIMALDDTVLQTEDGSFYSLSFDLFEEKSSTFALKTFHAVTVEGIVDGSTLHVVHLGVKKAQPRVQNEEPSIYSAEAKNSFEYIPLFILINFQDGNSVCSEAALKELVYDGDQNVQDLFGIFSKERASLEMTSYSHNIAGPYTLSDHKVADSCNNNYLTWRSDAVKAAEADGYKRTDYSSVIVVHPQLSECPWAGRASLASCKGKGAGCYGAMNSCAQFVFSHEMGHNLNLHHSGSDPEDDDYVNPSNTLQFYRDYSCLMGNFATWNILNSVKLWEKGWIDANRQVEVSAAGSYTLYPIDDATASGYQILAFEDQAVGSGVVGKHYFLSIRKPQGYSSSVRSEYQNGVNVHYKLSSSSISFFVTNLAAGETHETRHKKWSFEVESVTADRAVVKVINAACTSGSCNYAWQTGNFGACSSVCDGGVQTRTVVCKDGSTTVADGLCPGTKPATSQACNVGVACTYSWRTTEWSPECPSCSDSIVRQTRTAECVNGEGVKQSSSTCTNTIGARPALSQDCPEVEKCPSHYWYVGEYGDCSVPCGGGEQERVVQCRALDGDKAASDSVCTADVSSKPTDSRSCNTAACTACSTQDCSGRGECLDFGSTTTYQCRCPTGYSGDDCEDVAGIEEVSFEIDDDVDNAIQILWSSDTSIPASSYVKIYMYKRGNSIPRFITSTRNDGSHSFNHRDMDPPVFPTSGKYYAEVVFSAETIGRSNTLSVDPCSWLDCETCSGGVCQCEGTCYGLTCSTCPEEPSKCDGVSCRNNGQCDEDTGKCDCSETVHTATQNPWEGEYCDIAPTCENTCNDFGIMNSACTSCSCFNEWSGSFCETCDLDSQCWEGEPDKECKSCVCETGFTGSQCQLLYVDVKLGPFDISRSDLRSEDAWELFEYNFIEDIAGVISLSATRIKLVELTGSSGKVYALFRLLGRAPAGYSAQGIRSLSTADPDYDYSTDLDELNGYVELLQSESSDPQSDLYTGKVTATLKHDAVQVSSVDGREGSTSGSSGSSGNGGAVAAGVIIALIVIGALGFVAFKKKDQIKDYMARSTSNDGTKGFDRQQTGRRGSLNHMTKATGQPPQLEGVPTMPTMPAIPPRPARPNTLPLNWEEFESDDGTPYFYNSVTGESVWERPTQ